MKQETIKKLKAIIKQLSNESLETLLIETLKDIKRGVEFVFIQEELEGRIGEERVDQLIELYRD